MESSDDSFIHSIFGFLRFVENLKNVERFSFTSSGKRESVAEHSWRLAILALLISSRIEKVSTEKLLILALIHDLGEAYCGDIPATMQTPHDGKVECERMCMQKLCAWLPDGVGDELFALWEEYENGSSLEAIIVKGLDKIETLVQNVQGLNPDTFDYEFNLSYAKKHTDAHHFLQKMRIIVDSETEFRRQLQCLHQLSESLR